MLNTLLPFLIGGGLGGFFFTFGAKLWTLFFQRKVGQVTIMGEYYDIISKKLFEMDVVKSYVYGKLAMNQSYIDRDPPKPQKVEPLCVLGPNWVVVKINGARTWVHITEQVYQMGVQDRRIVFYTGFWNIKKIRQWCHDIIQAKLDAEDSFIKVYISSYNCWELKTLRHPRPMQSVYHKYQKQWEILNKIKAWQDTEDWHIQRGINFQYGLLLYGKPGTGKTTMALALASELKRSLYILDPNAMSPDTLLSVPENSIVLFDECDALLQQEEVFKNSIAVVDESTEIPTELVRKTTKLASFLTALDGPASRHNIIKIFTTNNKEALPASLLRDGRIDCIESFDDIPPADFLENYTKY